MNKLERHTKKMLKFKKRLRNHNLTHIEGNFNSFRTSGKPCSCFFCKKPRYKRERLKQ